MKVLGIHLKCQKHQTSAGTSNNSGGSCLLSVITWKLSKVQHVSSKLPTLRTSLFDNLFKEWYLVKNDILWGYSLLIAALSYL